MFYHTLSSSPQAFCKTIGGAMSRLDDSDEKVMLVEIRVASEAITSNDKTEAMLSVLKDSLAKLKQLNYITIIP